MSESSDNSLSNWTDYVFNHPVLAEQPWYWADEAPQWKGTPEQNATFIAETFEQAGKLLAPFSDEQLNQALRFLISNSYSDFMYTLVNIAVPLSLRLRALRSFVPLFEQVMAARCSPHLSHLDEPNANPLNGICYMWWDILPIHGKPEDPARDEFDAEVLLILPKILSIPHDACRESALHGVSEWYPYYPQIEECVDDFLSCTPNLRPELISYANLAKVGAVL